MLVPVGLAGVLWCAAPEPAHAASGGPPWLRIDRVEAEPSTFVGHARLRLFVTAVNLRGVNLDLAGARTFTLKLGSQKKRIPYIAGSFKGTDDEFALAVVIQTSSDFEEVLPTIKDEVKKLIEALPRDTRFTIIGYDESVRGSRRLGSPARALKALSSLDSAFDPGGNVLLEAMERARRALDKAKPKTAGTGLRKVIVVISDGRDVDPKPENYRKVSRRAGRKGIRIHSIAFAPDNNRLPLLGLAEMSKQSSGTFRFAYTKRGFGGHFEQLLKEIERQYVLTYFVPEDELLGKKVGLLVAKQDLESVNAIRVSELTCGEQACAEGEYCVAQKCVLRALDTGRGVVGWALFIGGIAVGVVLLFVVLSLILGLVQKGQNQSGVDPQAYGDGLAPGHDDQAAMATAGSADVPGPAVPGHPGVIQPQPAPSHIPHSGPQQSIPPSGRLPAIGPSGQHQAIQPIMPSGQHRAAPLSPVASGRNAPPVQHSTAGPSLIILKGPLQGQRVALHHGFMIGNAMGCHLQLVGDHFVSGHHAQILMDARGGCTLVDKGSTNGTFINGVRTSQKRLSHGMLIKIGNTEARFLAQ